MEEKIKPEALERGGAQTVCRQVLRIQGLVKTAAGQWMELKCLHCRAHMQSVQWGRMLDVLFGEHLQEDKMREIS